MNMSLEYLELNSRDVVYPVFIFEMWLNQTGTDKLYFTSDVRAELPPGAVAYHDVIASFPQRSQTLDPLTGKSTVAQWSAMLVDDDQNNLISELGSRMALDIRNMRGLIGKAYKSLIDPETNRALPLESSNQLHTGALADINIGSGTLSFIYLDVTRAKRDDIFTPIEAKLTETITPTSTDMFLTSIVGFETTEHDESYTDAPAYSTGTVNVENGSVFIVGVGTSWLASGLGRGSRISLPSGDYEISQVYSDTSITLTVSYSGVTSSGNSYIGFPKVGYVEMPDGEVIRFNYADPTYNSLGGLTHGVFNSTPKTYEVDAQSAETQWPTIRRLIYYEMPALKMALAFYTGELYNQPGGTIPNTDFIGVDPDYIDYDSFLNHKDVWDPTNNSVGKVWSLLGAPKSNGRDFIESQVLFPAGFFVVINGAGKTQLRRNATVTEDAPYTKLLTTDNAIINTSDIEYDISSQLGTATIKWDYQYNTKEFSTEQTLLGSDSATLPSTTNYNYKFYCLRSSREGVESIDQLFELISQINYRPQYKLTLSILGNYDDVEVGEIVRVECAHLIDPITNDTLKRSMRVISKSGDSVNDRIDIGVIGSTQKPSSVAKDRILPVEFFSGDIGTGKGEDMKNVLNIVGGVLLTSGTLTGSSDINASASVYNYADGDLEIPSGVTLTLEKNIQMRIDGALTCNGGIIISDGHPAGVGATSIAYNTTLSAWQGNATMGGGQGGSCVLAPQSGSAMVVDRSREKFRNVAPVTSDNVFTSNGVLLSTYFQGLPYFNVAYDPATNDVGGLPSDLRGPGGPGGGPAIEIDGSSATYLAPGGSGGAGSGAAIIFCTGFYTGVSAEILADGIPGTAGGSVLRTHPISGNSYTLHGGAGAGGGGGTLGIVVDGQAPLPDLTNVFHSRVGATDYQTTSGTDIYGSVPIGYRELGGSGPDQYIWNWYPANQDNSKASHFVQYLNKIGGVEEVQRTTYVYPPTSSVPMLTEVPIPREGGGSDPGVLVKWAPSTDNYLDGYMILHKHSTGPEFTPISALSLPGTSEFLVPSGAFSVGDVVTFRVHAVNTYGRISYGYIEDTITIQGDITPPGDIADVAVTRKTDSVTIVIDEAPLTNVAYYELYGSASHDFSDAVFIDRGPSPSFTIPMVHRDVLYVWALAVSNSGVPSDNYYPSNLSSGVKLGTDKSVIFNNWDTRTNVMSNGITGFAYADGFGIVAVGDESHPTTMQSFAGDNWTQNTHPGSGAVTDVVYGGNAFVSVGSIISSSVDGHSWVLRDTPSHGVQAVAYNTLLGMYATVGGFFDTVWKPYIKTSSDAVTWTERTVVGGSSLNAVASDGSKFIAGGSSSPTESSLLISTDGINWTPPAVTGQTTFGTIKTIIVGGDKYIALGNLGVGGAFYMLVSTDGGNNWTQQFFSNSSYDVYDGTYLGGEFILTTNEGILTSFDAVTWTTRIVANYFYPRTVDVTGSRLSAADDILGTDFIVSKIFE